MSCQSDNSFGPAIDGCRNNFDFTVLFEQIIFTLAPSCLFIVLSLGALTWKARVPIVVHAPWLLRLKLVCFLYLAVSDAC